MIRSWLLTWVSWCSWRQLCSHVGGEVCNPNRFTPRTSNTVCLRVNIFKSSERKNDEHGNLFDSLITFMGLILSLFSRSPIYCVNIPMSRWDMRTSLVWSSWAFGPSQPWTRQEHSFCRWNSVRRCSLDIFRSFETLGGIYWLRKLDPSINRIETYKNANCWYSNFHWT